MKTLSTTPVRVSELAEATQAFSDMKTQIAAVIAEAKAAGYVPSNNKTIGACDCGGELYVGMTFTPDGYDDGEAILCTKCDKVEEYIPDRGCDDYDKDYSNQD